MSSLLVDGNSIQLDPKTVCSTSADRRSKEKFSSASVDPREVPQLEPTEFVNAVAGSVVQEDSSKKDRPKKSTQDAKCFYGNQCRFIHDRTKSTGKRPQIIEKEKKTLDNNETTLQRTTSANKQPPSSSTFRRPVIRQTLSIRKADLATEKQRKLRETEIEVIKRRFPQVNAIGDKSFMATVEATDPDWPFDLKHIELNITVPDEYPLESLQIVVIGPKIAPELLCNHITNKIRTWFNEKMEEQTKNDSFQLMIRPFLMWLDRNLVDLFIEGLKKVRLDLQAKAAGISMVTHTKEKVIADSEITEESEKVDDVLVEKEEENKAEESTSVPESSLAESVDRLSLNSECSFSHNADIRFTSWHLSESVATLIADKLTLMKRCDRCSYLSEWFINCGRKHVVSCDQCHSKHEVNIHSNLVHHFCPTIALLNIQGCTPIDLVLLSSEFRVTCLQCNKETGIKSIAHGIPLKTWCQSCHSKLELQIDTVRVTSSKPAPAQSVPLMSNKPKAAKVVRDVRIREGEPLPETGTCKHYRKSFRWFRFPCCGKLYPCDVCHEEKESHEIKFANRIICGFCAKEQPYQSNRPCNSCGGRVVKSRSSHWEGGKGCRDVTTMSKSDNQKYVNLNKSVSNQKKKVDELKSKKKSKQ